MSSTWPLGLSSACLGVEFGPAQVPLVAAAGFSHLELRPQGARGLAEPAAVARLGREVRAAGLVPWALHAPVGRRYDLASLDEGLRREALAGLMIAFDQAVAFESDLVVVHCGCHDPTREPREASLVRTVRTCNELVKRASQRGLRLALELRPAERGELGSSAGELLWLQRLIDGEILFCVDVSGAVLGEEGLAAALRRLAPSLGTVYLSDNDGVRERHWLPGAGVIDWGEVRALLGEVGYSGPWLLEATEFAGGGAADRLVRLRAAARLAAGVADESP